MLFELPKDFTETLANKYESAVADNSVVFSDKVTNELVNNTIGEGETSTKVDFQLTILQSLQHRPTGTVDKNPFENPEPELTVVEKYGPDDEFRIVFNKFPVVPRHFMIVTREFKSQNTPLSLNELVGAYTLLARLRKDDSDHDWMAFYNCGPESGASQPHKHIQFMTIPDSFAPFASQLADTTEAFLPNDKEEPLVNADIPFAHFVARLPDSSEDLLSDPEDLTMYFVSLLQRVLTVLKENEASHVSYNFIMTTKYMMLVPRSHAKYEDLGINSCGYAGLILCKNEELHSLVTKVSPVAILDACGFPNTKKDHSDEYKY
ncbi:diadenosine 5',5'''-P1,P4-tetraphosphate phosphorylase 2 [[Candida] anglica]|uniref:Diadenosine 5',5'''-P1,P4-tetraphosphate phosphorylase 2 n=1 Tax=[Candida] anglica TaxID=148631 RepID=A0ABP0EJY3_9ASCO